MAGRGSAGGKGGGGGPPLPGAPVSVLDGAAPGDKDWNTYFCTYAYLYHQKDMLEDHVRTGAYFDAITNPLNAPCFAGKVVLDVGAGSGILALFAARAGARKVYAVEATPMARHARALVEANGFGDVVEVIQGTVESVTLPEKVDVIVSEWMGYLLVRESMLDSVLAARDAWLKPGGSLWPSHARLWLAPARSHLAAARSAEFAASMAGWGGFQGEVDARYGVDVSALAPAFRAEQRLYYQETSAWADVSPSDLLGPPACIAEFDLGTVTKAELEAPLRGAFRLPLEAEEGAGAGAGGGDKQPPASLCVDAFVGWFDVTFAGSPAAPAPHEVVLTTAPDEGGATHWGQQVFPLSPPVRGAPGDALAGAITITRRSDNHRLMSVGLEWGVEGGSALAKAAGGVRKAVFQVE